MKKSFILCRENFLSNTKDILSNNLVKGIHLTKIKILIVLCISIFGYTNIIAQPSPTEIRTVSEWNVWANTLGGPPDAILMNDIGDPSNPVTQMAETFSGTFDGNGFTIYCNIVGDPVGFPYPLGLFSQVIGYENDTAIIKNLTVAGSITVTGPGNRPYSIGGIVGSVNGRIGYTVNGQIGFTAFFINCTK